ncbi:zinc metalloprotease HtpX [Klebsiella pneumoniae subsp. pneumoniae]|nr:zinc metalloprotease HtpX [Klebsiella pneumoniae subsp. pneumoniae]
MISRDLRHAQNVGARHRWHNRLQTVLLVLTLLGIAAVAGSLLLGDGGLWLALAAAGFTLLLEPAAASGLTLRLYGARPLHPDEAPDLWAVLRELAARAGLPTVPVPHYVPSGVVNAFATGSKHHAAIALTDGLLRSLTPRELTGVLGHEIAHIANEDLRVMGLADSISRLHPSSGLVGAACDRAQLANAIAWSHGSQLARVASTCGRATAGLAGSVGLVQGARIRRRPARCRIDRRPARAGPQRSAKIERVSRSWRAWLLPGWGNPEPSWLRTHPATAERIERLLELAPPPAMPPFPSARFDPEVTVSPRPPRWRTGGLWR